MMKNIQSHSKRGKIIPLLLLLVFILVGYPLIAQEDDSDSEASGIPINFGGKFGATLSQFTDQQPYTNNAQGYTGGAFVRYNFSQLFSLQLEANYSQQGGRITRFDVPDYYGLEGSWYDFKVENQYLRMHNLEAPLLAQFSFDLEGNSLIINLGPAFSYNVHSGILSEGTVFSGREFHTYTGEENVSSIINSYEYSAIGGIGFEFDVSPDMFLTVDARYKYGINPVYEGYSYIGIPQIQGDLKNHSLYFTLGFGF
ncbi:MAG: porin family protein [Bacteroidales bacterium]